MNPDSLKLSGLNPEPYKAPSPKPEALGVAGVKGPTTQP